MTEDEKPDEKPKPKKDRGPGPDKAVVHVTYQEPASDEDGD